MPRRRRRRARDDGASAIELAFVAPAVLLLIFAIIQIGLWAYGRNVAEQAAREGVSLLRVAPAEGADAAETRTENQVSTYVGRVGQESLVDAKVVAHYDDPPGRVTVTVTGRAMHLVPGFELHVSRTASGEIERFEGDTDAGG